MKDYPLKSQVNSILNLQKQFPKIPVIENRIVNGCINEIHDFAAHYLALWLWKGFKPDLQCELNNFMKKSIRLAEDVYQMIISGRGGVDIKQYIPKDPNIRKEVKCQLSNSIVAVNELDGGYGRTRYSDYGSRKTGEAREARGLPYFNTMALKLHSIADKIALKDEGRTLSYEECIETENRYKTA